MALRRNKFARDCRLSGWTPWRGGYPGRRDAAKSPRRSALGFIVAAPSVLNANSYRRSLRVRLRSWCSADERHRYGASAAGSPAIWPAATASRSTISRRSQTHALIMDETNPAGLRHPGRRHRPGQKLKDALTERKITHLLAGALQVPGVLSDHLGAQGQRPRRIFIFEAGATPQSAPATPPSAPAELGDGDSLHAMHGVFQMRGKRLLQDFGISVGLRPGPSSAWRHRNFGMTSSRPKAGSRR